MEIDDSSQSDLDHSLRLCVDPTRKIAHRTRDASEIV